MGRSIGIIHVDPTQSQEFLKEEGRSAREREKKDRERRQGEKEQGGGEDLEDLILLSLKTV